MAWQPTSRTCIIELLTTATLLEELEYVLSRDKFAARLKAADATAHELVLGYAALTTVIEAATIEPVILEDPDDDAVLACAIAAQCEVITSGDNHLLDLKGHIVTRILTVAELLAELSL